MPRRSRRCSTRSACSSSRATPRRWRTRSPSSPRCARRRPSRRLRPGPDPRQAAPFSSMAPFMVSILAISVSDKIEQYGAYAGFASVLGLAVLSLLYFAQAREVKRLREWAGSSPERAADLQDRVQADAQRRAAAVPQAPQARHLPGHPATGPQQPATAAGQAGQGPAVAAPAAAAATAAGAATKAPAAPAAPGTPPAPGAQPTTVQPAAT